MKRSLWVLPLIAVAAAGFAQTASDQRRKAEEERMKKLEKAYTDAKSAFTRNPNNATLKKRYVDATVTFGTFTMNTFLFPPMQKYPRALRLYREALRHDPQNREALANKKMIEDIYRSMGRPIPQ